MSRSSMIESVNDLLQQAVEQSPDFKALHYRSDSVSYLQLSIDIDRFACHLIDLGINRYDRVAVFAEKRIETVVSIFGAARAGGIFVPVNPLLKPRQVEHILLDCNVRFLVTTSAHVAVLRETLATCEDLEHIIVFDEPQDTDGSIVQSLSTWQQFESDGKTVILPKIVSSDVAAILYTSGSTGSAKGVTLSHANLTIGAKSVAAYLNNCRADRILALLPLSFDAGLSQLTTAFCSGATVVLHNYVLPQDVVQQVETHSITGITGVPPLWMQLARLQWPSGSADSVRYFANTGGKMPLPTLSNLRKIFRHAEPFLMYGLTESFRSTFLPPAEVDKRPESIGIAIPNAEIMVVNDNGELCEPGQPGELVHRGPLVSLGYWNDMERTEKRFRISPNLPKGITCPDRAVFSGDTVISDKEGFLYFVARMDEMIKTSGYRVSPGEIEDLAFNSGLITEAVAIGVPHEERGQGVLLIAVSNESDKKPTQTLLNFFRSQAPNYMIPLEVVWQKSLPRNSNGKIDRKDLAAEYTDVFGTAKREGK